MSEKIAIVVLGMHRSGTSALAGCFNFLGASIGKNILKKAKDNKKGFFENKSLVKFNDQLLNDLNFSWSVPIFDKEVLQNANEDENNLNKLVKIIEDEFENENFICIKDPRLCFFSQLYFNALKSLNYQVKFIFQTRQSAASINSLINRNNFNTTKCELLWLSYNLNCKNFIRNNKAITANYDLLLNEPTSYLKNIFNELQLKLTSEQNLQFKNIENFITKALNNFDGNKTKNSENKLLQKYIKVVENVNAKTEELDEIYEVLQNLYNGFFQNIIVQKEKYFKYVLLNENGESVKFDKILIKNNFVNLNIDCSKTSKIKIFAANFLSYFTLNNVSINDVKLTKTHSTFTIEHGKEYIADAEQFISFDIDNNLEKKLNIEITYHSFGNKVLKKLKEIIDIKNDWFYAKIEKLNEEYEQKTVLSTESKSNFNFESFNNKIVALEKQKVAWGFENEKFENKIEALKLQLKQKEDEFSLLKIGNNQEIEKSELLFSEYENLKSTLNSLKKNFTTKEENYEKVLKEKEERFNNETLQKEEKFKILEKKNESLTKENENLVLSKKESQQNLNANIKQKEEELKNINAVVNEIKETLYDKKSKVKILENDLKESKIESKNNLELLNEAESKYNYLTKLYEELNHNAIVYKNENEKINEEVEKSKVLISKFEINNTKLNDEVYNLKNEIDVLNEIISNYHQKVENLNNSRNRLKRDIKDVKSSLSFKIGSGATWPIRKLYNFGNKKSIEQNKLSLLLAGLASKQQNPSAFLQGLTEKDISNLSKALKTNDQKTIITNVHNFLKVEQPLLESNAVITTEPEKNIVSMREEIPETIIYDESKERQKVLYISPNLPDFDESSGGKRATRMIGLLSEEFDVYCFTLGAKPQKYIDKLESVGAYVIRGYSLTELRKKIKTFNTIIFSFYYTYYDYHKFLSIYPDAKIIVDSVDVHWIREERSLGLWENLTPEKIEKNKKREIYAYSQADYVWAVTENDKQFILKEIKNANVAVVSNVHSPILTDYTDNNNNNMLFIGGYNHYPNISAVELVAKQILPKVLKQVPDAKLIIAGSKAPDEVKALSKLPNVEFKGFIEESEMDELYKNTFISVCPVLAGAGIKGKVCEAISYMTPVATNNIGNEGVNLENLQSGIITNDYDKMADDIILFMQRKYDLSSITKKGQENLYNLVGPQVVKKRMVNCILPEISICIVTWNRIDLLKRCIESIEGNTHYPNYKIIIHSNGCEDGTQDYLEAASKVNSRIVPVLSKDNEVFVKPNNNMAAMFPENDVVLLNNDTFVTEGWLYALFDAAYMSSEIGLSGSKILYPDGRLQEFGSELYENGSGKNIGKFDDPNKDEYKKITRVGYVSGCSLYVKRSTIEKIGLFDEQFHPCYCEDSDLCYTAWENDLQTVVTPHSIIYHDEGGTSGTDEEKGFKAYQKVNFEKFLNKHKNNLSIIAKKIALLN